MPFPPARVHSRSPAALVVGGALLPALIAFSGGLPAPVVEAQAKVDFATQIEPILKEHCYECHGPEKGRGKLRMHTRELAMKGGSTGPLYVPGKSGESYMVTRLLGGDDEDQMPLDKDPLKDEQIDLIKRWIDEGGEWPESAPSTGAAAGKDYVEHWAYVAPVAPAVPQVSQPAWVRTPVDSFVLARLDREGLAPSPEASKETLLRRVTLDLTGLPPTIAEIDAFLADTSADAYERVVDRLLASSHYGERWARLWLDLARYADTNGFEADQARSIWAYRDWVVRAFNDDMPFDQFTVEQLAGDMLPAPTDAQRIATGFHRNSMVNEEGGVDPRESRYEMLVDRVNTTATVWLGSTLACAQCHNHKYDPFSQKDYFRFMAFFASASYTERPHGAGTIFREPTFDLATPEQERAREDVNTRLTAAEEALEADSPERQRAQTAWEQEQLALDEAWTTLLPSHASASGDVVLQAAPDGSVIASGPNPEVTVYTVTAPLQASGITGLRLEALLDESLPKGGPGRDPYGHFRITGVDLIVGEPGDAAGSSFAVKSGKADGSAYAFDPMVLTQARGRAYVRKGQAWAIDAVRDGWRVPHQLVLTFAEPLDLPPGTPLTVRLRHEDGTLGQGLGRFRLSVTTTDDPERIVTVPARARAWMRLPPVKRTEAQQAEIASQFRGHSPLFADDRRLVKELREELGKLAIPSTLVIAETPSFERPSVPLYDRGNFTSPGDPVYAATPSALSKMGDDLPANRLGLARWLVARDNPLTARVMVNRLWESLFGRGIVETSEDFGTMASPPSHPLLLDALAVQFMEGGWRFKPLLRSIVLSATYRQASSVTPDLLQKDPYNRLFARGPRFRLEAEMVRDAALVASGRLSPTMGGPSVFPEQPDGIWDSPYNKARWAESEGEDRYRRSLYTFLKRTAPYPLFTTFDATSREYCTVRRVRTNTPLQALATLNDDGLFELAQALGARMVAEGGSTVEDRLVHGFRLSTGRTPTAAEQARLRQFFEEARAHYTARHTTGRDPEAMAWTMVGNVLLNLDEALTKG